jgi:hypothetical protein
MPLTPEVLSVLTATTGAIGVISLALYFYTFEKIRALTASEGSVKEIIQGEGLFQPEQVILILKEFTTDDARLEALKQLAKVHRISEEKAGRVYDVIRKNVDVSAFQNERYRDIQVVTAKVGPFFAFLAIIAVTYDIARFAGDALLATSPRTITIEGEIAGQFETTETRAFSFHHEDSDGNCDANRSSDKTWCLPSGWRVVQMGIRPISANCNSSIASPSASGESCAFVSARVAGCGYDNLVLTRNCRGRGFIEYEVTLSGEHDEVMPIPQKRFTSEDRQNQSQTHFVFRYDDDVGRFGRAKWTYQANVSVKIRNKPARTILVSNSYPTKEGVVSHIENGVLSIDIDPESSPK